MAFYRVAVVLLTLMLLGPATAVAARKHGSRAKKPATTAKKTRHAKRHSKPRAKRAAKAVSRRRSRKARRRRDRYPPMHLEAINSREKLTVRLYDRRERTIKSSVRKIYKLMRCHYTGKRGRIHWRLIQRMYRVSRHFKGRTLLIYSGYRSRKVARLRTSKHTLGRAMDFAVKGVSKRVLRDYLRRTYPRHTGVGYYPNSPFIHFDVRKKSAFWVDYSGKGEEPRYAKNPYQVLKQERQATRGKKTTSAARPALAKAQPVVGPPAPPKDAAPAPSAVLEGPPAPPARPLKDSAKPPSTPVEGPAPVGPVPRRSPVAQPESVAPVVGGTKDRQPQVSNVRSAAP